MVFMNEYMEKSQEELWGKTCNNFMDATSLMKLLRGEAIPVDNPPLEILRFFPNESHVKKRKDFRTEFCMDYRRMFQNEF